MNRYTLLYDTGGGNFAPLDLGDERPAMNFQINDIGDLKDRRAGYSQNIKLPKSDRNLRALGFLDAFDVVAEKAYTAGPCELRCDGARISPVGSILKIISVGMERGGVISCQIASQINDLFAELDDEEWVAPDDEWDTLWTADRIAENNNAEDIRKRWPQIEPVKGAVAYTGVYPAAGAASKYQYVQAYHLAPCYHMNSLVREIFREKFYDIETNLFADSFLEELYCTASKIQPEDSQALRIHSTAGFNRMGFPILGTASGASISSYVTNKTNAGGEVSLYVEDGGLKEGTAMRFYAEEPGSYTLELKVRNLGPYDITGNPRRLSYYIRKNGELLKSSGSVQIKNGEDFVASVQSEDLAIGDFLNVFLYGEWTGPGSQQTQTRIGWDVDFHIDIDDSGTESSASTSDAGIGTRFNMAKATGFKSAKDFLKAYLQITGAIIDIERTKIKGSGMDTIGTVRLYSFNELYRRRDAGQYVDWSSRLVESAEQETEFAVSKYAQRNVIEFKSNDDTASDGATITVNNATLEGQRTMFTIGFEAGRNIDKPQDKGSTGLDIPGADKAAVVPILEVDAEATWGLAPDSSPIWVPGKYKGCGSRIVAINNDRATWPYYTDCTGFYRYTPGVRQYPQARYITMQEYVTRYYRGISDMLHNARTLSVSLLLDVYDIEGLDLMTPVYLRQYGAYFYINKINNFIAGTPTKVELVKL